jgi:hypothetical protein
MRGRITFTILIPVRSALPGHSAMLAQGVILDLNMFEPPLAHSFLVEITIDLILEFLIPSVSSEIVFLGWEDAEVTGWPTKYDFGEAIAEFDVSPMMFVNVLFDTYPSRFWN